MNYSGSSSRDFLNLWDLAVNFEDEPKEESASLIYSGWPDEPHLWGAPLTIPE